MVPDPRVLNNHSEDVLIVGSEVSISDLWELQPPLDQNRPESPTPVFMDRESVHTLMGTLARRYSSREDLARLMFFGGTENPLGDPAQTRRRKTSLRKRCAASRVLTPRQQYVIRSLMHGATISAIVKEVGGKKIFQGLIHRAAVRLAKVKRQ